MTVRDALKFTNYRSALVSNWAIGWSVFGVQSSIIPLAAAYLATGGDMSNSVAGTLLASLAMATNSFGNALTQTFSGRFSDRFGRRVMAFSGLLLAGSAVTFMGFAPVAWVFVSLTACLGIGAAFYGSVDSAAVSDVIGTRRSGGQVLAVYQMCSDFGMILGPLVAGMIADAWGFVPAFIMSGLLLVAAAFTWARSGRRAGRRILRTRTIRAAKSSLISKKPVSGSCCVTGTGHQLLIYMRFRERVQ